MRQLGYVMQACLLVGILVTARIDAAAVGPVHIGSAETELTLDAGPEAPRVSRLALKGRGSNWEGQSVEPLIDHVELNGEKKKLQWHLNQGMSSVALALVRFVYDSESPRLRLVWEWRVRAAHGPVEHSIRIHNLSGSELWLPLQDSFSFDWRVGKGQPLEQFWVEKGAGRPSDAGTHTVSLSDGYIWTGESSTYAHPAEGQPREIIPYLLVEQTTGERSGWYIGVEFSGRTRITLARDGDSLRGQVGLNPVPGPFMTRVPAGESFTTPTVFVGAFEGGPDAAGNTLRRWVRHVLNNPVTVRKPAYPLLVSNSWGSGMLIDEAKARRMIGDAKEMGLEMFHLDAGWFRGVGDWYPDAVKFPHGLTSVAEYAHQLGLKFGLWVDWAQAGKDNRPGALNIDDAKVRDWLTTDPPAGWAPEPFKGITVDIGVPATHAWAANEVSRIVRDYHLDMLEHDGYVVAQGCMQTDHPHAAPDAANTKRYRDSGFDWVESTNSTDVSYHATEAYYDIYGKLRREHPELMLEICNDGGRMVDFGSAAHGDYFSITDSYDPLSNRRAFYDSSYVLPSAMLETYVEKWPTPSIESFRYMLRSGMMGWFTLMQDSTAWTAEQHAEARNAFALYKSRLRPLIREADLYHVSARPDGKGWDGVEYFDAVRGKGVLFAFHGSDANETNHRFILWGLRADRVYQIKFNDHSSADKMVAGRALMQSGVDVTLPLPNSSELVFIQERR